jgi:leucyl aminopeptidase (aminopeptidase T)
MTKSDWAEIDFVVAGDSYTLKLILDQQEAQKSHGLCLGKQPDIANLPAGEVYFVPAGAEGQFPMLYEDGTLGLMHVSDGRIQAAELLQGDQTTIDAHNAKMSRDPVTGVLGELGFGTQVLPVSGRDIQDEKILGTVHVATGRSDHLGGDLTPDLFEEAQNATHDDILFAPHKTPQIHVPEVRIHKNGETIVVIEDFQPAAYLRACLEA